MLIFIFLGTAIFAFNLFDQKYDVGFIFLIIPIIFIARGLSVIPLSFLLNCCRKKNKIDVKSQLVLCFTGLRGAISFTLCLNYPNKDNSSVVLTTTMFIVFFTILVLGGLTVPVLKLLKIPMHLPVETTEEKKIIENIKLLNFDRKYLKPIFTNMGPVKCCCFESDNETESSHKSDNETETSHKSGSQDNDIEKDLSKSSNNHRNYSESNN